MFINLAIVWGAHLLYIYYPPIIILLSSHCYPIIIWVCLKNRATSKSRLFLIFPLRMTILGHPHFQTHLYIIPLSSHSPIQLQLVPDQNPTDSLKALCLRCIALPFLSQICFVPLPTKHCGLDATGTPNSCEASNG